MEKSQEQLIYTQSIKRKKEPDVQLDFLTTGGAAANCYLLSDTVKKTALLIEGSATQQVVSDALEKAGCSLSAILLTHGHFDHFSQLPALLSSFSCPAYISEADRPALEPGSPLSVAEQVFGMTFPGCPVSCLPAFSADGKASFSPGGIPVTVYKTPGHTKGGVCYQIADFFFTGDTLMPGSYGRCDFPGGDMGDMHRSLFKIADLLRSFPETTQCCPGHGDCFSPTEELRRNPYLI